MFDVLRNRLTYSNIAATLALVFAMSGGAYAVTGHGGSSPTGSAAAASTGPGSGSTAATAAKSKAKSKSKAGARGPAGPQGKSGPAGTAGSEGKAGAAGPQGPAGAKGENGTAGANGANGASVTSKQLSTSEAACAKQGGAEFTAAEGAKTTACNGTTGFTSTLPPGKTETGAWGITAAGGPDHSAQEEREFSETAQTSVSFSIPLDKELGENEVHYVASKGNGTTCPGSAAEPLAEQGNLCLYQGEGVGLQGLAQAQPGLAETFILKPTGAPEIAAGTNGAVLIMVREAEEEAPGGSGNGEHYFPTTQIFGSWAVTETAAAK